MSLFYPILSLFLISSCLEINRSNHLSLEQVMTTLTQIFQQGVTNTTPLKNINDNTIQLNNES